jgi:hydroxymethylpyrimidine/phosphomethylpyrimidine kinase
LTEQNTRRVRNVTPVASAALRAQAELLFEDVRISAVKLGLMPNLDVIAAVAGMLERLPDVPVVCDPVLRAGTGTALTDAEVASRLVGKLAKRITVLTPNSEEAHRLSGETTVEGAAVKLMRDGVAHVLVTGTHEAGPTVVNRHFHAGALVLAYEWPRLPDSYHGSGCTLAAALAAELALGAPVVEAIAHAQGYTWETLAAAVRVGAGQLHPWRARRTPRAQG